MDTKLVFCLVTDDPLAILRCTAAGRILVL